MSGIYDLPSVWEQVEQKFGCDHEHTQMTKWRKRHGVICVYEQCTHCGENVGERRKADHYHDNMPWFDEDLRDRYRQRQQEYRQHLQSDRSARIADYRERQNAEWWRKYSDYLRSPQWHTMRQRVLERDGHTCRACLNRKATQVHHLSYALYDLLGYSLAHELIAICVQCHTAIHPHMAQEQQTVIDSLHDPFLEEARKVARDGR